MKAKIIGAVILIVVIACAAGYYFYGKAVDVTVINGYLGGEKIGIMEDEQITDILAKKYHIAFDYSRAGLSIWSQPTSREGIIFFLPAELLWSITRSSTASLFQMR